MATYFHGGSSEFQAAAAAAAAGATPDGMQTLYLMNPNYVPYSSDTHQPQPVTNMFFLNPAGNALNPTSLPHAPPPPNHHHHYFPGLPLQSPSASNSDDQQHRPSPLHGGIVSGVHHHQYYNLWGSSASTIDQNSPAAAGSSHNPHQGVSVAVAAAENSGSGPHDVASSFSSQLGFRRAPAVVSPRQGLSLSLSSQQQAVPNYNNVVAHDHMMRISGNNSTSTSVVSNNGISGVQSSVVLGSKYLRAAQELLDEVVNVGKVIKTDDVSDEGTNNKEKIIKMDKESVAVNGGGDHQVSSAAAAAENGSKREPTELTTAQRQELQTKKAKLATMLDEVEQRYRQYHHQMQVVVSSFEQAAGFGAAKSYTALALQTISKQFRCLKDAISGQIKATSKSLGEEDCIGAKIEGSRLRYVDHQVRQQRALQQLGMIQHNAWRPQRGLPERAVSVLRAWLFEHFLHPYPKDSDKHMLAKQTGLTRSQVSNWFINARVRLWKPMVEEMYLEEVKEQKERNGSEEINIANKNEQKKSGSSSTAQQDQSMSAKMDQVIKTQSKPAEFSKSMNQIITSPTEFSNSTISTSPMGSASFLQPHNTAFNLIGSSSDHLAQRSPKKPRSSTINELRINSPSSILSMDMEMKQGDQTREFNINFGGGGFGTYSSMGEIGRFVDVDPEQLTPRFHGNSAVSLTLGLPHCENLSSLSGNQQNLLSNQNINQLGRRLELGPSESDFCGINTTQQTSHSGTAGYDNNIEMQNRKRFAAQLLPDFVA